MTKPYKIFVMLFTFLAYAFSGVIIAYILIQGIPNISPGLFEWQYTSKNVSIMPALVTTLFTIILTLLITLPMGIFTAVYLSNYAKNKRFIFSGNNRCHHIKNPTNCLRFRYRSILQIMCFSRTINNWKFFLFRELWQHALPTRNYPKVVVRG